MDEYTGNTGRDWSELEAGKGHARSWAELEADKVIATIGKVITPEWRAVIIQALRLGYAAGYSAGYGSAVGMVMEG